MRILLVDDDPVIRLALAGILRGVATELVQAEDGEQAWALLQQGLRPLVCCCDVAMPRLDGIGLLRRAAADCVLDDLPFVLISSAAEAGTLEAAAAAGAQGYVLKPFLAAQTVDAVEAAARRVKAARAEHYLVTRRRLEIPLEALSSRIAHLRDGLCTARPGDRTAAAAATLAAQAQELGLWRCARLLAPAHDAATAQRRWSEAADLADDQFRDIARLAPTL